MTNLNVASEFSRYLGGRSVSDGPWSGEEFRDKILRPRVLAALRDGTSLKVVFDGVAGMPTSFLEEAFGGLLRHTPGLTVEQVRSVLILTAEDPELWPFIKLADRYIDQQAGRSN